VIRVCRRGDPLACEVVGFDAARRSRCRSAHSLGVGADDEVESDGRPAQVRASEGSSGASSTGSVARSTGVQRSRASSCPSTADPPSPLDRRPSRAPRDGRARLDGVLTLGEGQRVGLFAGSGVGKSTLLGAIARGCDADVVVVALVGERGREVGEFLERSLGAEGREERRRRRDERRRGARAAPRGAGGDRVRRAFPRRGARVLLARRLGDAVRAGAARGRPRGGRASGAPRLSAERVRDAPAPARAVRAGDRAAASRPSTRCSSKAATWTSRSPTRCAASSTATSCSTGRSRREAATRRSTSPASLSRVMDSVVVGAEHRKAARRLRALLAAYEAKRDWCRMGAYAKGSDKELDEAMVRMDAIERFLRQEPFDCSAFETTVAELAAAVR
jgi:hypothetical protein